MDKEFDWPGGNYTYKSNQNSIGTSIKVSTCTCSLLNDNRVLKCDVKSSEFCLRSKRLEQGQNYKDLYGVTGA